MDQHTLGVGALGFLSAQTDDNAEKDTEKLQGTWVVVSAEQNSEKMPAEKARKLKVIFREDLVLVTDGNRDDRAKYKLDTSKKPCAIDLMPVKDKRVVLGIYSLEGDTLKICYDPDKASTGRPEEFTSKGGKERVLMILKREKL